VTAADVSFQTNSLVRWLVQNSTQALIPNSDAAIDIGGTATRVRNLFATIIDSGTTGSLSLRTANGAEEVRILHSIGGTPAVNFVALQGSVTGANPRIIFAGGDANVPAQYFTFGSGTHFFYTGSTDLVGTSAALQVQINHVTSATTSMKFSGASGTGKPLIDSGDGRGVAIFGTNTNDNAATGQYGEFVTANVLTGASVALATGVSSNVTSITLGAGDWDVEGCICYTFGATTSYTNLVGGASSVTGTLPTQQNVFDFETPATVPTAGADMSWVVPKQRFSLNASTTIFLVAQGTFTVSTLKAYGVIRARRVR